MNDTKAPVASATTVAPAALEPETIVEQLRALRQQIPDYGQITIKKGRALRNVARAHSAFLQAAINSVGASEAVRNAVGMSADALQRQVDLAGRWTAVEDDLRALP